MYCYTHFTDGETETPRLSNPLMWHRSQRSWELSKFNSLVVPEFTARFGREHRETRLMSLCYSDTVPTLHLPPLRTHCTHSYTHTRFCPSHCMISNSPSYYIILWLQPSLQRPSCCQFWRGQSTDACSFPKGERMKLNIFLATLEMMFLL